MKQVEASILGQSYLLACPDGAQQRLAAAVAAVDREMMAIRDAGKVRARERIAVLAALNLAFDRPAHPTAAAPSSVQPSPAHGQAGPGQPGPTVAAASMPAAVPAPSPSSADAALIAELAARIDEALGEDGLLL